jgi:hypothetical protein
MPHRNGRAADFPIAIQIVVTLSTFANGAICQIWKLLTLRAFGGVNRSRGSSVVLMTP